jgi:hydrogenase maturation protease
VSQKALVLGLGNTLLGDEGAGVHAVRHLAAQAPMLPDVDYLDGGTLSFTLAGAIEDADHLIVIDAAELHAAPGTVRVFEGAAMDEFLGKNRKASVHEVSLMDLLVIARLTDSLPARRALIGIQPQYLDWADAPTPAVAQAIPAACAAALGLLRGWRPAAASDRPAATATTEID